MVRAIGNNRTRRRDGLTDVTGFEAGLSGKEQVLLALEEMDRQGGRAVMSQLYDAVDSEMSAGGFTLSEQGKASLRTFINRTAVRAGYVMKASGRWELTQDGREAIQKRGRRLVPAGQ